MVKIIADTPALSALLQKLCATVQDHNGFLNPGLIIHCKNGDISVMAEDPPKDAPLLRLPHDLMLPYDDFSLTIENSHLEAHSIIENFSPVRQTLLQLMLDFYNKTDKIRKHLNTSAWHVYRNEPEIINPLLQSRQGGDVSLLSKLTSDTPADDEELTLLSFFKNRLLSCRINDKSTEPEKVLMPIADFLNHHRKGAPYNQLYTKDKGYFSLPVAQPVKNSPECYAHYGFLDTLDTYLHYSFIDPDVPFVRSIPVLIELEGIGTLDIKALNVSIPQKDIPAGFKDLKFYMPMMNIHHEQRKVEISHIMIPDQKAPRALHRIIYLALSFLVPDLDELSRNYHVKNVIHNILETNFQFYIHLESCVKKAKTPLSAQEPLLKTVQIQKNKIQSYQELINSLYP